MYMYILIILFRFSGRDHDNMRFVLRFSSSVLANTLAFQRELTLKKQNQALLQIAKKLFSNLSKLFNVIFLYIKKYIYIYAFHTSLF